MAEPAPVDLLYQGIDGVVTRQMVREAINERIRAVQSQGWSQGSYLDTMEHMMEFPDNLLTQAKYRVIATTSHHPFVIGDAPVVTWIRIPDKGLSLAEGFGRPDVEAFLPVSPTACLHVLPPVQRTLPLVPPSVDEVNLAQASLAAKHCFANSESPDLDAFLQPYFGTVRVGIDGYRLNVDAATMFYNLFLNQTSDGIT